MKSHVGVKVFLLELGLELFLIVSLIVRHVKVVKTVGGLLLQSSKHPGFCEPCLLLKFFLSFTRALVMLVLLLVLFVFA